MVQKSARSEVEEELGFHLEERVRDYIDRGMDPESARRAARERVGDLERVRSECAGLIVAEQRAEQRRVLLNVSWLDVKLSLRMLVKHPGVTQRRREIGIRSALGAQPQQLLRSVFSRAARQIALGLVAGVAAAVAIERLTGGGLLNGRGAVLLPALVILMALVGLVAALGPARHGLRIQPIDALKEG